MKGLNRLISFLNRGSLSGSGILDESEIEFVICVEANRLEPQARLLCESIREFGGRYRNAPITAVSPRLELAPTAEATAHLEQLGVRCVVEALNTTGRPYGTINRIVAGAWAETHSSKPYLVILDTDMIFVGEPGFMRVDAGVRPVDVKGSASTGADDSLDAYWRRMAALGAIDLSRLPMMTTSIDRASVRASYNGGFAVVRRELGILTRTRDIFFASMDENLRPGLTLEVFSSTGSVGAEASAWWGSSQAALSIAIWSATSQVLIYDARYNIPLNNLVDPDQGWELPDGGEPILLHYHHLAETEFQNDLRRILARVGCSPVVRTWIDSRLGYFARDRSAFMQIGPISL